MTPADLKKYEYNIIMRMALHPAARIYLEVFSRTGLHTSP